MGGSWPEIILLLSTLILLCLYLHFKLVTSKYWSKRKIPHLKPVFLLGNMWRIFFSENFNDILARYAISHRNRKLLGFWFFNKPALLVVDPELVTRVLIKDFKHFRDRGIEFDLKADPLAAHLFILSGVQWRNLRVRLTPTFTSGKMKMMFPTIIRCGLQLRSYLETVAESKCEIEVKDLLARFTTDVIGSCAFGIETNSLQNPNSEFRKYGRKIFQVSPKALLANTLMNVYPGIKKILTIRTIPKDVSDFFINSVRETIEYREKNNVVRNDFLQLLIQLIRTGRVEDVDKKQVESAEMDDEELVQKFSLHEAAAQCFVFFAAGFETSSTAMSFALYELALNPDFQRRLQEEVDDAYRKCGSDVTYEAICGMEYLDKVVQETLRKYPPVGVIQRVCNEDYDVPEMDAKIVEGDALFVPVKGFHYNPDLFPDPEKFDPERFSPGEKRRRDNLLFLPFGDGPRSCIGNRFGLLQVKVGLVSVLKDYRVEVSKNTPVKIELVVSNFIPSPVGGLPLAFVKRK